MNSTSNADAMNRKRTPPPSVGEALPLTDADLDELSGITLADIENAQTWARVNGSRRYNALLNAKEDDGTSTR